MKRLLTLAFSLLLAVTARATTYNVSTISEIEGRINGTNGYVQLGSSQADTMNITTNAPTGSWTGTELTETLTIVPINPVTINGPGKTSQMASWRPMTTDGTHTALVTISNLNTVRLTANATISWVAPANCDCTITNCVFSAGGLTASSDLVDFTQVGPVQTQEIDNTELNGTNTGANVLSATAGTGSVVRYVNVNNCYIHGNGPASNSECVITHGWVDMNCTNCTVDATGSTAGPCVAPGSAGSPTRTAQIYIKGGTYTDGNSTSANGAYQIVGTSASPVVINAKTQWQIAYLMQYCNFKAAGVNAYCTMGISTITDTPVVKACTFDFGGIAAARMVRGGLYNYSVLDSYFFNSTANYGCIYDNNTTYPLTVTVVNCRFSGVYYAVECYAIGGTIYSRNNIGSAWNSGGAMYHSVSGTTWNCDYDCCPNTYSNGTAAPSRGAHSVTASPSLDGDGYPTASGNCQGTGLYNATGIESTDLNGANRVHTTTCNMGPLEWRYKYNNTSGYSVNTSANWTGQGGASNSEPGSGELGLILSGQWANAGTCAANLWVYGTIAGAN